MILRMFIAACWVGVEFGIELAVRSLLGML